jgi:imidazolonepropionase-like amidohydrolase
VPGSESRPGATVVELPGETCMPGLIDMHVHISDEYGPTHFSDEFTLNPADHVIRSTVYAKRTLLAGFTTIRNMGDTDYETVALRNQINKGWIPGPRIFTAGPAIGSTGGHADPTDGLRHDLMDDAGPAKSIINGPDDAWKAVRQHYKEGADVIKIMTSGGVLDLSSSADNPQLTQEEINAIVAAAKDYGFTVAVHAHGAEAIRRAIIGGVDSIEHGTFMDDKDMQLMKEHGTFLVPTVYTGQYVAQMAKVPGTYAPQVAEKALAVGPQLIKTVSAAYKAGVKFAYGTDEGVYAHGQNWRDFPLLVQAGIPPIYAIQMATVNASQLLKREKDVGSIAPGKYADVVAVPGNPLNDINLMSKVNFVMKGGTVYKQDGKEIVVTSNAK